MNCTDESAFDLEYEDRDRGWVRLGGFDSLHDAKDKAKSCFTKKAQNQASRFRILWVGGAVYECTFKVGSRVNWVRRV